MFLKERKCNHDKSFYVEDTPFSQGYCRKCIEEKYENASICPYCGNKNGFSYGTGDCSCQSDFDVGF